MFFACAVVVGCGNVQKSERPTDLSAVASDRAVMYDCQGEVVKADFNNDVDPQTVQLFFVHKEHEDIILSLVPVASGVKYTNEDITFWTHQDEATLAVSGKEDVLSCTLADDTPAREDAVVDVYGNFIPKGCKKWFDGCNTCSVSIDGDVSCTRKACAPTMIEPARCIDAR